MLVLKLNALQGFTHAYMVEANTALEHVFKLHTSVI